MIANVLVGTASWTDKSLIGCGRFYPPACRTAEERLRFYARQFPMVEVDSSYYGMPTPRNARLWAERTPPDYYADLPIEIRDELWRRFLEALAPPNSATPRGSRASTWKRRLGRSLGLVHTVMDSPQGFANCVPCVWEVTNPRLAILRLHGRNRETWNRKGLAASSARFDYWYSQDELAAMLPEIRHMATLAEHVHVIFNTNNEDQGQVGARMMRELLRVNAA